MSLIFLPAWGETEGAVSLRAHHERWRSVTSAFTGCGCLWVRVLRWLSAHRAGVGLAQVWHRTGTGLAAAGGACWGMLGGWPPPPAYVEDWHKTQARTATSSSSAGRDRSLAQAHTTLVCSQAHTRICGSPNAARLAPGSAREASSPFSAQAWLCSSLLPISLRVPVALCSSVHSPSPPGPDLVFSVAKSRVIFLEVVPALIAHQSDWWGSCLCLRVSFVRAVSLCILFLVSPFPPLFPSCPILWSDNLTGINFLTLSHVIN